MKRIAFVAALVVAVLAAAWFLSRPEPVAVTLVTAERGPVAQHTGHAQGTPVRLNNAPAQRQPQPRAHARRFGRKERFKDARLERRRHTWPSVRHAERDLVLGRVILRGDGHLPDTRGSAECLLGVGEEIDEHLL